MAERQEPIPVAKLKQAKASAEEISLLPETLGQCAVPGPEYEDGLTTDEKFQAISRLEVSGRTRSSEKELVHEIKALAGDDLKLRYGWVCQAGFYPEDLNKKNQDNLLVAPDLGPKNTEMALFGVFDGHGKHGTECSTFAVERFSKCILAHKQLKSDPELAIEDSLVKTNKDMHKAKKKRKGSPAYFDDTLAGTTAINVMFVNDEIVVANVGDSRAILATATPDGKLVAQPLSADQTPYRADERSRCKAAGAVVMTMDQLEGYKSYDPNADDWGEEGDDGGDPPRLWLPNKGCPGVAFTRSLGDEMAESIGCVAKPEILRRRISPDDRFLVIASDGVFEFLATQTVADIVSKFTDPYEAARALVTESYKLWLHFEVRTDDITAIVIFLEHPRRNDAGAAAGMDLHMGGSFKSFKQLAELQDSRPVRREMSRQKRQMIEAAAVADTDEVECEPENAAAQAPKSAAQIEQIRNAVSANFLFQHLNAAQLTEVVNAFRLVEVAAGDVVIKQGEPGDRFFVVGSGEYDCFLRQGEGEEEKKVHTYVGRDDAVGNPSFGELALMYSKPRAASVVAKTAGVLWSLDRRTFRRVLVKPPNKELLSALRRVEILSSLGRAQLQRLVDSVTEESFEDGDVIIRQGSIGESMYVIKSGGARATIHEATTDVTRSMKRSGTLRNLDEDTLPEFDPATASEVMRLEAGGYFGERALLQSEPRAASVLAVGKTTCFSIRRNTFEEILGPLSDIIKREAKHREVEAMAALQMEEALRASGMSATVPISELTSKYVVSSSETITVRVACPVNDRDRCFTLKSYHRSAIEAGKSEPRVLREREIMPLAAVKVVGGDDELTTSKVPFVFPLLKTWVGAESLHGALQGIMCGPLLDFMSSPLSEEIVRFVCANVALMLEEMHHKGLLLRSINPQTLVLDDKGYVRLADMGWAKRLEDDNVRTFTLCGDPAYVAPEQVLNMGHSQAVDFWALGILAFEMLTGSPPYSSSEDPFSQIAEFKPDSVSFPDTVSAEARGFIMRLLQPDLARRLTSVEGIFELPFFNDFPLAKLRDGALPSPLAEAAVDSRKEILASPTPRADEIDAGPFEGTIPESAWFANF